MKQVQFGTTRYRTGRGTPARWVHDADAARIWRPGDATYDPDVYGVMRPSRSWLWGRGLVALFGAIWFVIALPFRLVFWTVALLGRVTGVVTGFVLMVVGMALLASPLFIFGIPLFVIGLVLTLRCLE